MAGIGFRLRKIMSKGTYGSMIAGYFYGALISTGPWIISVASIAILSILCRSILTDGENLLLRTIIIYTYMGTLVLTGPFYMSTTRFLADRMFQNDFLSLLPTYRYVVGLTIVGGGILSGGFYLIGGLDTKIALAATALFEAVCITWAAMIFLSAARDYVAIARAFCLGYFFSVVFGWIGAELAGLTGVLWGFAGGMFLLATLLSIRVVREFPSFNASDSSVLSYWRKMPWLGLCGFCYNAALWADKLVYWIASGKKAAPGPFFAPLDYDTCFFWAYLTIVPSMTIFLIRIETSFYQDYAEFFGCITQGRTLTEIEERRKDLCANLRLSVIRLLKIQGGFSAICILIAPAFIEFAGLSPSLSILLRIALITAFVQSLFLIEIIIVLYFDWRKMAALLSLLALVGNVAFTLLFHYFASATFMGFGCLLGFLLALVVGLFYFQKNLKDLVFETFAKQIY